MSNGIQCWAIFILIIAANVAFLTTPASCQEWISFDGVTTIATEPGIEVQESNISRVGFEVAVYGMSVSDTLHEADIYQLLNIPGYSHTNLVGAPKLPAIRELVAIPKCEDITFHVVPTDSLLLSGFLVYPVPKKVGREAEDGFGYPEFEFVRDDSLYSLDSFYPQSCGHIIGTGYIRGQRVAHVEINPVRFNPVSGKIVAYLHFEVQVEFASPQGQLIKNVGPFTSICRSRTINYTK